MNQEIIWQNCSEDEYKAREMQVRRLPLLQSSAYTSAIANYYGHTPRSLILLSNEAGTSPSEIGLCKILKRKALGGLLEAIMCDRGPVWFESQNSPQNNEAFIRSFARQIPRRFGRKRRFIPEYELAHDIAQQNGFRKSGEGYDTIWVDLTKSEETLRADLKKNWRGSLKKAEQTSLTLEWDNTGKSLPFLLKTYEIDKKRKDYPGPSVPFMKAIAQQFAANGNLLIGRALLDKTCIGSILILCHGSSATYQIGWTSSEGRLHHAHHLLLWNVLDVLKQRGTKDFDLGGINDKGAKDVAAFKQGMGGYVMRLPGLYT